MNAPAFEVITENELGVIRLAECDEGGVLWNIKGNTRGLVISRDDDHTSISLRVPLALVTVFAQEIAEQRAALKDSTGNASLVWGGPAA